MLKYVQVVSSGLIKDIGRNKYYDLQNIVCAIEAYSPLDKVFYTGFDVPIANPFWGSFKKFARSPTAYASSETIVEIFYNKNLDLPWRRFVVSKELCHALDRDDGSHCSSNTSVNRLISQFALLSAEKETANSFAPYDAEILAEFGALELLCPLEVRKEIYKSDTPQQLCVDYGIPEEYAEIAFDEEYLEIVGSIYY